ncbi:DNA-binding protein [Archaeoglobales archaeon]|nr:MAG: DNA-binding protein [Archaeoglobales archaeon]
MKVFKLNIEKAYFVRLEHGKELIEQILEFLNSHKIEAAFINGIGAVTTAEIGYYDQTKKEYIKKVVNEPCEILSLSGNASVKDGKIFAHLHVVLGYNSKIYCGHLFKAKVFACELFVLPLVGKVPERKFDDVTGLQLWL